MVDISEHFSRESEAYDKFVLDVVPYYPTMIDTLVGVIDFDQNQSFDVLDLGCGTGRVTQQIKDKFPRAKITSIDCADKMLEIAKHKLSGHTDIQYILSDFCEIDFDQKYDVIVSCLAMHHIREDKIKQDLFSKIHQSLNSGGLFCNADVVIGGSDHNQEFNLDKWKEFMRRNISQEDIDQEWIPRYYKTDRPCRVWDELKWLEQSGFMNIDVIWKYFNVAVYSAEKG